MGWQSGVMGDHGARTQAREEAGRRKLRGPCRVQRAESMQLRVRWGLSWAGLEVKPTSWRALGSCPAQIQTRYLGGSLLPTSEGKRE